MYTKAVDYQFRGWWWLRSPFYVSSIYARIVCNDGKAYDYSVVSYTYDGVVPALTLAQ